LHGVLRVARRDSLRRFGAEDLHLLTALGGFIAALADHALAHRDALQQLDVLRGVLDLAPTGFAVFDDSLRPLLVNATARAWLGGEPAEAAALLAEPAAKGAAARTYLRLAGKLIAAETLTVPVAEGRPAARVVVLVDVTPEQTALLDTLTRELYRTRCLGQSLSFALLEHTAGRSALLALLPTLRANLPEGVYSGPYDAHRIGLVLPQHPYPAALRQLRCLRALLPEAETAAALVAVDARAADGEAVLAAALAAMRPVGRLLRPAVLLHDDYAAVNDALELVLRHEFEVVKSSDLAQTRALLAGGHFDALVTELDLNEGVSGLELAREARGRQPELRTVFTAAASRARREEDDLLLRQSAFFGKPFVVGQVAAHLRSVLAPVAR
jgi:CheY-like chemotaxis protein